MEALAFVLIFVLGLIVLDLLAVTLGAESRDGFTDDTLQPRLR